MVSSIAFVFLCIRQPSWISRDGVVVFMIAFSAALMILEVIATIKNYRNITTVFLNIIIAYGTTACVMYAERFPFLVVAFGILFVAFVLFYAIAIYRPALQKKKYNTRFRVRYTQQFRIGISAISALFLLMVICYHFQIYYEIWQKSKESTEYQEERNLDIFIDEETEAPA
jgi:cytochrome bd-type quinol oxidase subunit 2